LLEASPSGPPLLRLLFVDDAKTDYSLLVRYFEVAGCRLQPARVETAAQMREALSSAAWDAVLCELELPGFSYTEALTLLREADFAAPFIIVSGAGDEDAAVEALVNGADDYVSKSRLKRLLPALKRSLAAAATRRQERAQQLRHQQSQLDAVNEVTAAARDLHDGIGAALAELAADVSWLAANAADDAARVRVRNMQHALDRMRAGVARWRLAAARGK
jgi:DNA-binding NtrC family response regulator